jgi:hypothetical protein
MPNETHTLLLAAVAACASPTYAQDSAFFTTSDGVKIHYLTMGNSGSWVVLIHGYTDTAQRMVHDRHCAGAREAHRVVALDNRNHGQSDKPAPNGPGRAGRRRVDGPSEDRESAHSRVFDGRWAERTAAGDDPAALHHGRFRLWNRGIGSALRAQAAAMDDDAETASADAEAMNRFARA